jgi:glycosyltransferase involved in cell wall biosynthesis
LFGYGKQIGFRIICAVFELFEADEYKTLEQYNSYIHIRDEVYLKSNAILSISEYIDKYYEKKGMQTYCFPPMVDITDYNVNHRKMDKYRFIILSGKDSLKSMLQTFSGLEDNERNRIELHLCGIKKAYLDGMKDEVGWDRLKVCTVFHEWMRYEELVELYQDMHFLVIARNVCQRTLANFPSKVPESMACGIVPVVSEVGDYTKYYLKDGYDSIFIQGDSVEEIRNSIRKAMSMSNDEYEVYSLNALKTARERFDYHVWSSKMNEMLQNI